tara:strand:+ start:756 stop:1484 length:729 start_codon:yes stop_codon:yes gene_type:complete
MGIFPVRLFAAIFQINLFEAEKDIYEYKSIAELFTRKLKPGARPIKGKWVHPVDAEIREHGKIEHDRLLQVKGRHYDLKSLLKNDIYERFFDGYFITYYLCPTDYHRIHSCCSANIFMTQHIPGKLWPVNDWSVNAIQDLFAINERVVSYMRHEDGLLASVKVGATNVGKISLTYEPNIVSNQFRGGQVVKHHPSLAVEVGEELGCFHMGSTVIILLEKALYEKYQFQFHNSKTKLGEAWST